MAEVAPYVLRYWETEFPSLSEGKERGPSRLYTAREVRIIARIRELLYDEGFTVAGAKKRLEVEILEGRFDDGEKAPPLVEQKRKLEEPRRPVAVPSRTEPVRVVPSLRAARAASESSGFPDRKNLIRELKEIVKLLSRSNRAR